MRLTPVTAKTKRQYDHLPAEEAVRLAWTQPGTRLEWHAKCVEEVRASMPLLARAIDRLVQESRDAGS